MKGLVLVVSCLVLAGCGSGAGQGVTLPPGTSTTATTAGVADAGGAKFSYRGTTSQRQRMTIAVDNTALAKFHLQLRCKDGGSTVAAIATLPHRPNLQPDGSFYYSETGTTEFSGFGNGRYRVAMAGQLQGANGAGHASFRISFKSTTCRTAVSWQVKKV